MSLTMCESPLFFTDCPEKRRGGIVVAGLNWGAACDGPKDLKEVCTVRWTPSDFYDIHDRFRCDMTRRFAAWGHDPRLDKEFDSALVATNLFYNATQGVGRLGADSGDWDFAIRRLFRGAEALNASGVLIAARLALGPLHRFLKNAGHDVQWTDAGGCWQTCRCGNTEIAVGPHYRARAGWASTAATKVAASAMSAWLDRAMVRFWRMYSP